MEHPIIIKKSFDFKCGYGIEGAESKLSKKRKEV